MLKNTTEQLQGGPKRRQSRVDSKGKGSKSDVSDETARACAVKGQFLQSAGNQQIAKPKENQKRAHADFNDKKNG